jgi:hypothetical protein
MMEIIKGLAHTVAGATEDLNRRLSAEFDEDWVEGEEVDVDGNPMPPAPVEPELEGAAFGVEDDGPSPAVPPVNHQATTGLPGGGEGSGRAPPLLASKPGDVEALEDITAMLKSKAESVVLWRPLVLPAFQALTATVAALRVPSRDMRQADNRWNT